MTLPLHPPLSTTRAGNPGGSHDFSPFPNLWVQDYTGLKTSTSKKFQFLFLQPLQSATPADYVGGQPPKLGCALLLVFNGNAPRFSVRGCHLLAQRMKRSTPCNDRCKEGSDTETAITTDVQFVQVMSGSNRRDWTPAFPDDHNHDGLKRDTRYYYPRNHLL